MSSRHSAIVNGAPSGMGAAHADCVVTRGDDATPMPRGRTRTRAEFQRPFRLTDRVQAQVEDIRLEERRRERARMVHELHDTLFQGFVGASMLLDHAVEQTPADFHSRPALSHALALIRRALDEGRKALRGLPTASTAPASLEEAFSKLLEEIAPGHPGTQIRIFVQGRTRELNSAIREQLFVIGREAIMNALRHSAATNIEVEIRYLHDSLRLQVRDNGCGIKPEAVQRASDSHWGLSGMRERAKNIGAQFDVWSRIHAGTEVCVGVPVDCATPTTRDLGLCERRHDSWMPIPSES